MTKSLNGKMGWLLCLGMMAASSQAFAYGGFTAIVFNPSTGGWGSYHGSTSRQDAELNAQNLCGADCAGVDIYSLETNQSYLRETWASDGWVAYARGDNGHFGTGGQHLSQDAAEQSALANCGGYANGCYVVRSVASFINYEDQQGTNTAGYTVGN